MTFKGKKHSEETRRKMRETHILKGTNLGTKNIMWKGNDVGYNAVHTWIRKHLPRPELCPICNLKPPYECANISGSYLRDFTDWWWICRSCHMRTDGRIKELHKSLRRNAKKITAARH